MNDVAKYNYNGFFKMIRLGSYTLREFSKLLDVDYSYLCRLEKGARASDETYIHMFEKLGYSIEEVDLMLTKSNCNLLKTIHCFCYLDSRNYKFDDSMCIDAILNNAIVQILDYYWEHNGDLMADVSESKKNLELLKQCAEVLNVDQKRVLFLINMYYAVIGNDSERVMESIENYEELQSSKYTDVFYKLLNALNHYFENHLYTAIIEFNEIKDLCTREYLLNWSFVIDSILYTICRIIDDNIAMSMIEKRMKEFSKNDYSNEELCYLCFENLHI